MEQKQKKDTQTKRSYGAVILVLLLTCFAVGCFGKHPAGSGTVPETTAQSSSADSSAADTTSSDTQTQTARTEKTEKTETTSQKTDTSAARTDTSAADTTSSSVRTTTSTAASTVSQTESTAAKTAVSTASQTTASETEQTSSTASAPAAATGNWMLTLVNRTHPVPDDWTIETVELRGGVKVDARMYPSLQNMFDDMRAQGINPFVREGYRTREYQQQIMQNRINTYLSQGYSQAEAKRLAEQYVAVPGTSEHELGLAVDINAAQGTASWTVYNWLAAHAHQYGFIQRYPDGKTNITGIGYEPWHYRYVGEQAAAEIHASGLTLEEYLGAA